MIFRNIFYVFAIFGLLTSLSSRGYAMENEDLKTYRVQTASVLKQGGIDDAHGELERQAELAPMIKNYKAVIMAEERSRWNRTQLICENNEKAEELLQYVYTTALKDHKPLLVKPGVINPGQDLPFEYCIPHEWK